MEFHAQSEKRPGRKYVRIYYFMAATLGVIELREPVADNFLWLAF